MHGEEFLDTSVIEKSTKCFHNRGSAADKNSCSPSEFGNEYVENINESLL
jgi:hypothetical protein